MEIWTNLPMAQCPHCMEISQVDDYYDFTSGDSFYCVKCEKEIFISVLVYVIECKLSTEPDNT